MQPDSVTTGGSALRVDRWIALLAGRDVWADAEEPDDGVTRVVQVGEGIALLMLATSAWMFRALDDQAIENPWVRYAPVAFSMACMLLAIAPLLAAAGNVRPPRRLAWALISRVVLAALVVVSVYGVAPGWYALLMWPIAVPLGLDVALTSWVLGWKLSPGQWWRLFLLSPLHLGVVGGLLGAAAFQGWGTALRIALPIYATVQAWVLVATAVVWVTSEMHNFGRRSLQRATQEGANAAHRRSAHWLHDDLASELRLVSMRLQRSEATKDDVDRLLSDLDHHLRMRQLDELFGSGSLRVAEVLQPYLRRAQSHGLVFESVPSFDDAALMVTAEVGRTLSRGASTLISNALNAGATTVSVEVTRTTDVLSLAVIDNAGGWESHELPLGRGLWSLRADPQVSHLGISHRDGGSRVEVGVVLTERTSDGSTRPR